MSKLRFYPGTHTYWVGGQKLESVTNFVGRFFSEFNAKEIARKLAKFPVNKKQKKGVRFFLKEWKNAAIHGTRVHGLMESYINSNLSTAGCLLNATVLDERDLKKFFMGVKYLCDYGVKGGLPEVQVYNTKHGLAGTIDLITYNEDQSINLVDWKTNKKIKKVAYNKKTGKPPVAHLPDANFYKYALQLSIYAYMLEEEGMKISTLTLVHLEEDNYTAYSVPYIKTEVEDLLNAKEQQG